MQSVDDHQHAGSSAIDLLAEAWIQLSDSDNDDGKGNIPNEATHTGYLNDDWSKDARRLISWYAKRSQRPTCWPWKNNRFDMFWEKTAANGD